MGKYSFRVIITGIALCMLAAFSLPAQAQRVNRYRARSYSKADVDRIIRRVENQSDRFVNSFDRALDNSRMDGTRREDNLNQRARDLESSLNSLRQEFDRRDRYQDTRSQVSQVLTIASGINGVVKRQRLKNNTERLWTQLRTELNALASVYNLRQLS